MIILDRLQNSKLGLIELILMGYDLYLKNITPILLIFCVIYLPGIIIEALFYEFLDTIDDGSILLGCIVIIGYLLNLIFTLTYCFIYFIILSLIITRYIERGEKSKDTILNEIFYNLIPVLLKSKKEQIILLNAKFGIIFILRCLLLIIPGLIYIVNNNYYSLAFMLRNKTGKAAFNYSQVVVKGNWWRVFSLGFVYTVYVLSVSQAINGDVFSLEVVDVPFSRLILTYIQIALIGIGLDISFILLFLNLEFEKGLISITKLK